MLGMFAAEKESLAPAQDLADAAQDAAPAAEGDVAKINQDKERNWAEIPVGVPFTEMVKRAENFSVSHLEKSTAGYRETWMKPQQV
jgi:hypothetical protein